ncbi:cysteine desulfurase family protein [Agromyces seonyuensis]|uniref:cysteine desulfurase n=1 Tax=Agromyces seonyuensis TaxID=2662446 RepID=A0A6I4P268_9MICO|nr:cysteine desulfurase family protein [Agromyces seonyuensis]MWB98149.1 aminotransferase class V-fold PLP-dependent enzyme [Agromyces seonyuensis]
MIYLDHAATSPVRREAIEAMWPYLTGEFGNPSSVHGIGDRAAHALADARASVAEVLGVRPGDVVFTSGGTEADNLAVKGLALGTPRGRHVVVSPIEHEAVLESADALARLHGFAVSEAVVDGFGRVAPDALAAALRPDTALVSLHYANNEVGTVQPIADLARLAHEAGALVHTDAVQAAGWLPLGLDSLGVDALSLSGHKVGAPKGMGVLAVRGRLPLEPVLHGGGQERGRRSGTENVAGAVALATALRLAEEERAGLVERIAALRDGFVRRILAGLPDARLTGDPVDRLPNLASFTLAGVSGESVLLELERRGVIASSGSACAAGRDEPSHVLTAMGVDAPLAQTAVRFAFGRTANAEELAAAASAMLDAVAAVGGIVTK